MGITSSIPVDTIPDPSPLPGSKEKHDELRKALDGRLHTFHHDQETYNKIRANSNGTKTWNIDGMGKPIAIAVCQSAEDVSAAVAFCREHCQPNSIRVCVVGGRYSHQCMVNNLFVVDLSGLKGITINKDKKYADIMGGSLQDNLDTATEPYHLAMTAGHISSTGYGEYTHMKQCPSI